MLEHLLIDLIRRLMADLTKLEAAVATLSTNVDALIAAGTTGGQAQIDTATATVTALDDKVVAATKALTA